MNSKYVSLFAAAILAAAIFAGCAQDSTNTSDDNPAMQESVMKEQNGESTEKTGSESTNPTRDGESSGSAKGTKLTLSADPTGALKYNTAKLNANAGAVTIAFTNESSVPHDVAIESSAGKNLGTSEEITKGSTTLEIKDLKAGSYTFFCTVPGHEQAGMKGTLTVR
ncbi:MAG: cupredoxin domain-containing protein [Solirubrobacterales bacterium]